MVGLNGETASFGFLPLQTITLLSSNWEHLELLEKGHHSFKLPITKLSWEARAPTTSFLIPLLTNPSWRLSRTMTEKILSKMSHHTSYLSNILPSYGEKISNLYRVPHIFDSLPHTHHITTSHSPKAPPSIFSPEFFNDNPTSKENPSWSHISNTTCHSTWWYF